MNGTPGDMVWKTELIFEWCLSDGNPISAFRIGRAGGGGGIGRKSTKKCKFLVGLFFRF